MFRCVCVAILASLMPCLLAAQSPQRWTLQPVVSIGGAEANDERYAFDRVTVDAITGRLNGNLLVLDVHGQRVLEYDASGRHVRTQGRAGEGPGELRFPTAIAIGAGDSAWVFDVGRITVYPAEGGGARTQRAGIRTFGPARVRPGGFLRALAAVPASAGGTGSFVPAQTEVVQFNAEGATVDTVLRGPLPARVLVQVQEGTSVFSTHATEQYGVTTHWDMLRDGSLVISDSSAYVLRLAAPDGSVVRTFGTGEPARRTTAADRERALDRIRAAQARLPDGGAFAPNPVLLRRQLEQTPFSPVIPRVVGVRVDPQDRIWVGVSGERRDLDRIDVYDRNGRLIATITDPPGMPAALYGDDQAALLERDELDAQRVRILRIVRDGR
jgi:hypothetical protein